MAEFASDGRRPWFEMDSALGGRTGERERKGREHRERGRERERKREREEDR